MDAPFFIRFLLCNITLSILIIVILLTKKFFKKHISIKCHYFIWFILIFMLLIPFISVYSFQFGNIINFLENIGNHSDGTASILSINNESSNILQNSNWLQDFSLSVNRSSSKLFNSILVVFWIIGIIIMSLLTFYCNHKIRKIKMTAKPVQDKEIIFLFEKCMKNMAIKQNIFLSTSHLINAPITLGLFQPYIILPNHMELDFSQNEIRYIFLHELQHYKHKDIIVNYVICIFQILYWYNPLVWYALKEMRGDREIACDISVLNMLEKENYKDYGNTIINFADKILRSSSLTIAAEIGGSNKQITKRILKIASFQTESRWLKIKSTIIFVLIGIIVLGSTPILSVRATVKDEYNFTNKQTQYEDLSNYFDGYEGSFVLYDKQANQYYIYNKDKIVNRTSPDSTYKIFSALYGLETGIIAKDNSSFSWDGTNYPFESWNKNQDLSSAMNNSVTWYFQHLDEKIGIAKLQSYYKQINYGNSDLSGGISNYWMESSLKISPIEQVELLKAFYLNQFGFQEENIQTVKDTLLLSESNGSLLSGKTGTGKVNGMNINGWFIGYVENNSNTYFFATNIQNNDYANGSTAAKITLSILKDKNIYK